MHLRHPTILAALLVVVVVVAGCGTTQGPAVPTTPATKRTVDRGTEIVLRGDYGPDRHGPVTLDGRYAVRFTQRGAGVDFAREVPFTAHLEQPTVGRAPPRIALFKTAARTGSTTITAHGRYDVVIDFGDSPYEIVIRPLT